MARTNGVKAAARARWRELSDIAPTRKRTKGGAYTKKGQGYVNGNKDPREVVLSARCRRLGMKDTRENRLALSLPMFGDDAGRAISIGASGQMDRDRLWACLLAISRAMAIYHQRILGKSVFAKCGKTEYMPERLETSAEDDAPADARTPEERDRAAVNAWMHWHGMVQRLDVPEREAVWDGVYMRTRLHHGGKLTAGGSAFVRALRFLEEAASHGR